MTTEKQIQNLIKQEQQRQLGFVEAINIYKKDHQHRPSKVIEQLLVETKNELEQRFIDFGKQIEWVN